MHFRERYGALRALRAIGARETPESVSEELVQCIWYDQLIRPSGLTTADGRPLRIVSPGWWNRGEGPDFKGAQIDISGRVRSGDVEIHLNHSGWRAHGHHLDSRYDDVLLHVVLEDAPPGSPPVTSQGRVVTTFLLPPHLEEDILEIASRIDVDEYPYRVDGVLGHCAALVDHFGSDRISDLLHLAGEWRALFKARTLRERMERSRPDQALYEAFLTACGYSHFKHHFRAIAQQLPYERARQLAKTDAMLLEAAFLHLGKLLPADLPEGGGGAAHFGRLRALRRDKLPGLRPLPLEWKRVGVRPTNYPERRLAGAARFIARTAQVGLVETLERIWDEDLNPKARRERFEEMFPAPMGFWADHCTWTGKKLAKPNAPLGPGRVRSIIGNVFVPAGLAWARIKRDRALEERVFEFFAALPREPENQIEKVMVPRLFGLANGPKLDFRTQQGLLQVHRDWCEPNPSCRNCRMLEHLGGGAFAGPD